MKKLIVLLLVLHGIATSVWAQCGGVERWAVKMAADPAAAQISLTPIRTSMHDLVRLPRPNLPSDDFTRTTAERAVRVVDGRLVKFKEERGKTGDSDFHLVISDETLLYSAGGAASAVSPHSFIAEIPHPDCVPGRNRSVTGNSAVHAQITTVRDKFVQQFPELRSGWNDAGGIPVRLTGIVFFDRPHGQVGRALNGIELHPLLDIEFNPVSASVPGEPLPMANAGFENGTQEWMSTAGVITDDARQSARSGQWKAWLGGHGEPVRDRISRRVTLPATARTISLTFYMKVETDEEGQTALDKLRVRIRDSNGQFMATLKTFSNLDATHGYTLQSIDLTAYKGRTIRIELESQEDAGSDTSFVIDDVAIIVEGPA